ncbi:hypothetical protein BaRGS_00010681 [Batillaria attramentaria]|uniref:Secreted protein n=1 Tax=Batillaria attramentaria TaxID=370345 RepID=A0ABD0LG29_9CAEN
MCVGCWMMSVLSTCTVLDSVLLPLRFLEGWCENIYGCLAVWIPNNMAACAMPVELCFRVCQAVCSVSVLSGQFVPHAPVSRLAKAQLQSSVSSVFGNYEELVDSLPWLISHCNRIRV